MHDYQLRVITEKKDLDEKIEKLGKFVLGHIFHGLDIDERKDMLLQLGTMELYSLVLEKRIQRFSP